MGHTPPYTHRHSGTNTQQSRHFRRFEGFTLILINNCCSSSLLADLVNLPEEPIKEEEEEEEEDEDDGDEDMDSDDRVVEYKERAERERGERGGSSRSLGAGLRSRAERSPSLWSESDEMDYDLELKMISTPSPKKSKKMTMYADELDTHLKSIRSVCTK